MPRRHIRALVTGAGTGPTGNIIRALRSTKPIPYIVGVNSDRFTLKQSTADSSYLCPPYTAPAFVRSTIEIVKREQINVILPMDDEAVKMLSDRRRRFPFSLFLPRRATIDLCEDKHALAVFLRRRAIPAPRSYAVQSLGDLKRIFARFSRRGLLWCRARRGSRSLGALPISNVEQARAWITLWRDLRGMNATDFEVSEYLPGRHFVVQSVWRDGSLLLAQTVEALAYFAAGNNPSGTFSIPSLAKTVVAPHAFQVAVRAIRAIDRRPSGTFLVELRETADGTPCITEINPGRFPSGSTIFSGGEDNMIEVFVRSALGDRVTIKEPHGSSTDRYLVRDIDAIPGVFSAEDLLDGIQSVRLSSHPD